MSDEAVLTRLDLIAALAKQLAKDVRDHKLWEGDLSRRLGQIREQATLACSEARDR